MAATAAGEKKDVDTDTSSMNSSWGEIDDNTARLKAYRILLEHSVCGIRKAEHQQLNHLRIEKTDDVSNNALCPVPLGFFLGRTFLKQ